MQTKKLQENVRKVTERFAGRLKGIRRFLKLVLNDPKGVFVFVRLMFTRQKNVDKYIDSTLPPARRRTPKELWGTKIDRRIFRPKAIEPNTALRNVHSRRFKPGLLEQDILASALAIFEQLRKNLGVSLVSVPMSISIWLHGRSFTFSVTVSFRVSDHSGTAEAYFEKTEYEKIDEIFRRSTMFLN